MTHEELMAEVSRRRDLRARHDGALVGICELFAEMSLLTVEQFKVRFAEWKAESKKIDAEFHNLFKQEVR